MNARTEIVINNNTIEQVNSFNYFGYTITVTYNRGLEIKMNRFNRMCSTIRRVLINRTRKETQREFIKLWQYGSEIWTATETRKQTL
jgi:hypothetical protein